MMKAQLLAVLVLAIGMTLLGGWKVGAEGPGGAAIGSPIPDMASANRIGLHTANQGEAGLSQGSNLALSLAFTVYLPVALNAHAECLTLPRLISPANGSTLNTLIPVYQWDSGNDPNVTDLYLEVWLDPGLTQWADGLRCSAATCLTGIHQWRTMGNLAPATIHYWRAYLACGSSRGPYTAVWSFTTGSGGTILPAPTLLSPVNGSTIAGRRPTVQWSAVGGAVEYYVNYTRPGGGTYWLVPTAATEARLYDLDANTTYEWWVQARNDYAWGPESVHWHFTTSASSVSSTSLAP
jgi:hypothetical protein